MKMIPSKFFESQLTSFSIHPYRASYTPNTRSRNETSCKKCLTSWLSGQFTLKFKPSKHNRKQRRQHKIDKLQRTLKETDKKSEIVKLKRQIEHLQKQNNHVAVIYSNLIPL